MVKYVKGMLDRGINILTISVQNEPEAKQIGLHVNMIQQRKQCLLLTICMKSEKRRS